MTDRGQLSRRWSVAVIGYGLAYFGYWLIAPVLLHQQPPGDDFEQLLWAAQPALGYSKHPPLPSLILWALEQCLPVGMALVFALGGLCVALMMRFAWLTARASISESGAFVALLLISCVTYYTLRMHYYNHNTALLAATAAAMFCAWHADDGLNPLFWIALGAAWGFGLLSKYQMVLPILCNAGFLLASPDKRWQRASGLALAAVIATLIVMPHILWLIEHDFPTFGYASKSLGAQLSLRMRLGNVAGFLASQALRLLPAAVLAGALLLAARRRESDGARRSSAQARRFWAIHAWGPIAIMVTLGVVGGAELQMHWGTAFLWAIPIWFLTTAPGGQLAALPPRTTLAYAAIVQALLMLGHGVFPGA